MAEATQVQSSRRNTNKMMVQIDHLDKLLSLAGEVIITSSTLHDLQRDMVDSLTQQAPVSGKQLDTVKSADESARRISQDLHDLVMAIRLVEVGETFRLFRRPIRDLCRSLGREIDLRFEGENVLIDKTLSERLVDPLLHLLRNAVDHGVETSMERSKAGKPPSGTVVVRAIDHDGHTEIVVNDDGRGIDSKEILNQAKSEKILRTGDRLLDVLCRPGFSTRRQATATSGRGVGLDIVRSMVNEFDGSIDLETRPGHGTTFTLEIPKLRAVNIVDALLVRAGEHIFALDIDQVVAMQSIAADEIQSTMEKERFIKYLGEIISLFDLSELLGGRPLDEGQMDRIPLVIVEGKNSKIAVTVSDFLNPQKLVNVPLDTEIFQHESRGVAGTTVLSGGRVGITIDVDELVAMAVGEGQAIYDEADFGGKSVKKDKTEVKAGKSDSPQNVSPVVSASTDVVTADMKVAEREEYGQAVCGTLDLADQEALVDELRRSLGKLQDSLLTLETAPDDEEILHDAFRRLHGAKGNFTMLGCEAHARVSHRLETVLDYLRSERIAVTSDLIDLLLDGLTLLTAAAGTLPDQPLPPNPEILARLDEVVQRNDDVTAVIATGSVVEQNFTLSPTVRVQLLSAVKRGDQTYETCMTFRVGRQAEFLVAYLLLRRLGLSGTVFATLPSIDDIEAGRCGDTLKILWSSPLDEEGVAKLFEHLAPQYDMVEQHSVPTTVFRYENG